MSGEEEREWSVALGRAAASQQLRVGGPAQAAASLQSRQQEVWLLFTHV